MDKGLDSFNCQEKAMHFPSIAFIFWSIRIAIKIMNNLLPSHLKKQESGFEFKNPSPKKLKQVGWMNFKCISRQLQTILF